ncbi:MAG TPA: SLBB domain-containing protein [bacterium]|nr:SLBB domain-containing protein [bacterium]
MNKTQRRAGARSLRVGVALSLIALLVVVFAIPGSDASAAPKEYVLGPGDAVDVVVYGQADLSEIVTVKPDGMIALPLVGQVKAAGRTTAQLEQDLVAAYRKYLKAPTVSVKVNQFRTNRIYVLGQVFHPGQYELKPSAGILELLAAAGGPTTRADLAKAVLIRDKTDTTQLDLVTAIKQSKDPAVALEPEDVVYIPETDARIIVLGQVNKPGAYDLLEGQRVTDLIAGAGGPTAKAALAQAFVVRGEQQIPVDLKKALAGDPGADIVLQPRDMMVVPESRERIAVLGAVNKPGPQDFKPDMKLVDAIALAGGQTNNADLRKVQIIRIENGQGKTINVDFNKVLRAQDPSQNVQLQNGDIVYVSQKGFTLALLGGIVNIYYLLRTAAGF